MVPPKVTEVKKIFLKNSTPQGLHTSLGKCRVRLCASPSDSSDKRDGLGLRWCLGSTPALERAEWGSTKSPLAMTCGSVGSEQKFAKMMSFWLSRQFPQNCPHPLSLGSEGYWDKCHPSPFPEQLPSGWWRWFHQAGSGLAPGCDSAASGERFKASQGPSHAMFLCSPAVIACTVHFPRQSPWLCSRRATENESDWVTDEKPGEGGPFCFPTSCTPFRKTWCTSWALGLSDFNRV